ncbi:MAG: type I-F CRISPR-associated protein Csy1 [Pelistega sp.]|nr:type I-F CRISPR-associated protein Csy1 [Pelistega sp.]
MEDITKEDILQGIDKFLLERYEIKAKKLNKALETAQSSGEQDKSLEIKAELKKLQVEYERNIWIESNARTMAKQLKFGTHISKGIHSYSKGGNVLVNKLGLLPETIVGSQSLTFSELDANGNSAALPLASFLDIEVKSGSGVKLRNLIVERNPVLQGCFSNEHKLSAEYEKLFRETLIGASDLISADERNKQILWPIGKDAIKEDSYLCCIPLHSSVLINEIYTKINDARYSDENKKARENRYKNNVESLPYVSINQLAVLKLGGSQPQNVGKLTLEQGGRVYLLPALPPMLSSSNEFKLSKVATTIFNKRLRYYCRRGWYELVEVIDSSHNRMEVRDQRKLALDLITQDILTIATYLQTHWPAGWSKGYKLSMEEKYWLDPQRTELEGEEQFKNNSARADLESIIPFHFARWLNEWLREKYPRLASDFDDAETREWQREMAALFRLNQGSK